MTYTAPDNRDINFTLSSGYTNPDADSIYFSLGTVSGVIDYTYLEGNVLESSTPIAGSTLHLYKRSTGAWVSSTVTTSSGTFAIPCTDTEEYYFLVSLFPTDDYNALIYDYLYPTADGG